MLVVESRSDRDTVFYRNEPGTVFRRRRCPNCGKQHITIEMLEGDVDAIAAKRADEKLKRLATPLEVALRELLANTGRLSK